MKLAGKEYPMTIRQAEEEKYRRAAQDINALISVYKPGSPPNRKIIWPWPLCRWPSTRSG